jgi:NAD(P)-dependent dehydrogenase (short-subunit alcohol dehydrogenase family)
VGRAREKAKGEETVTHTNPEYILVAAVDYAFEVEWPILISDKITGALAGVGRATTLALAHEGSRVVISGRRDDAGQAFATELRTLGAEAEFVRADVRHEDDVRKLVDKTVERFGRLDVAVNNAGIDGHSIDCYQPPINILASFRSST